MSKKEFIGGIRNEIAFMSDMFAIFILFITLHNERVVLSIWHWAPHGEVDDDEEVLIFDESRDLNCDSVSLLIQRSVSTLINLVKVIDRVANVPTTSSAGILSK